jgi:hypothetical protein
MRLPTANEINPVPESLDGRAAQRHFLGKTAGDALEMFQERFEVYQEDLMFMGAPAFLFYFPVAIDYAESAPVRDDPDVASTMLMLMRHRCRYEPAGMLPVMPRMAAYCDGVLKRLDPKAVDRNIYGNLEGKYERFLGKLKTELLATPNGGPAERFGNSGVGGGPPSVSSLG